MLWFFDATVGTISLANFVFEHFTVCRNLLLLYIWAVRIVKIRAEAMHECNQRIASGMLTVRVSAASQLDEAMAAAREHAKLVLFTLFFFLSILFISCVLLLINASDVCFL